MILQPKKPFSPQSVDVKINPDGSGITVTDKKGNQLAEKDYYTVTMEKGEPPIKKVWYQGAVGGLIDMTPKK